MRLTAAVAMGGLAAEEAEGCCWCGRGVEESWLRTLARFPKPSCGVERCM